VTGEFLIVPGSSAPQFLFLILSFLSCRALVLANQAKEEQASKKNDPSKLSTGPRNRLVDGGQVNADGTPKRENQSAIDARKKLRISGLCHFLFLEDERTAGYLTLSVIQVSQWCCVYQCTTNLCF